MADEGHLGSITFGTSGFSSPVTSLQWQGVSREALETTHLGTTGAKTFQPADLHDPGTLSGTYRHVAGTNPPYSSVAETITLTFPVLLGSTDATGAKLAASGFVTEWNGPSLENDTIMDGDFSVKFSGVITNTTAT